MTSVARLLDHVVIAGPDLAELVAWFADRTGVTAAPGGVHPRGTANALIAFTVAGRRGSHYLELIGPDPAATGSGQARRPDTFGIADLDRPTIVTYAVHPGGIDAVVAASRSAGYDPGDVADLSRTTPDGTLLAWRLARREDRFDVPFLIDWGDTPHPGLADLPTLELLAWQRIEPDPEPTRDAVRALGLDPADAAELITGEPARYRLVVAGPTGEPVEL
ncbi:VOC family protein [Microlunatus sp. GCM10028923]|uniref:VOC family protein n=1 Tax=Microlunatus sp. GCM10028923 TaxID=3273400 RepID=UPI003620F035